jgi:RNA polymerase sigma-70 factor, ECF subfamily
MDAIIALNGPYMTAEAEVVLVVELAGFEAFYRREYPGLLAVATALSGAYRDGEDLVQDTMVRAIVGWRRVQSLDRPGGWCHRVLLNLCRGWYRRRRSEARYFSSLRRTEPSAVGPGPEAMAFWEAVRRLPSRPRMVVALYYAGDRPITEIASVLGVPEGTIRSDLSRARQVLSAELLEA